VISASPARPGAGTAPAISRAVGGGDAPREPNLNSRLPIGQQLVQEGHLDHWQLLSALSHQRQWGGRLGQSLVRLGFVTERVVLAAIGRQLGVAPVELGTRTVAPEILRLVPARLVRARKVLPLALDVNGRRETLIVATAEPQNLAVLDEVAFAAQRAVRPVLAGDLDLEQAIERHLGREAGPAPALRAPPPPAPAPRASPPALRPPASPRPVAVLARLGGHGPALRPVAMALPE